jgi:hypothetical protein
MRLRALVLAVVLLGLLTSTAWADNGHKGGVKHRDLAQPIQATDEAVFLTLSSGRAAPRQLDPTVTAIPPGGTSQAALVCANAPDAWARPLAGSRWISVQADCEWFLAPAGTYQYSIGFQVPANTSGLRLSGSVLADDSVTVQLNGQTLFTGGGFKERSSFSSDGSTALSAGPNTLTFAVNNLYGPTGLDFVVHVYSGSTAAFSSEDEVRNHGQCVSAVAHDRDDELWRNHGQAVSQAAQSECSDD